VTWRAGSDMNQSILEAWLSQSAMPQIVHGGLVGVIMYLLYMHIRPEKFIWGSGGERLNGYDRGIS
jgi:hypothetical protein